MNRLILSVSLVGFIFIFGCKTGKKALQRGNYDLAVTQAVNRLKSNGDSKKATATLESAYRLALNTHQDNISRAKASTDQFKWEQMANEYQSINNLYDAIRRCPSCIDIIPNAARFDNELATSQQKAAEVRYRLGVNALEQKQSRDRALEAHEHFIRVKEMVPRFKDIEDKLSESLYFATLKVVVEPIPSPSRLLEVRHEFFVNKINEYLHRQSFNQYVRFYTPQEAENQNLDFVDHVISMEFDQFTLGNIFQNNTERQITRDSVVVAQKDGQDVYGTVKATLRISERALTGGGVLDFKIIDNETGKVVSQEKMPSEYVWTSSWATFKGDERALSEEELALTKRTELAIPNAQIMFEEFTAPLYDQVIGKLRHYYRGY